MFYVKLMAYDEKCMKFDFSSGKPVVTTYAGWREILGNLDGQGRWDYKRISTVIEKLQDFFIENAKKSNKNYGGLKYVITDTRDRTLKEIVIEIKGGKSHD